MVGSADTCVFVIVRESGADASVSKYLRLIESGHDGISPDVLVLEVVPSEDCAAEAAYGGERGLTAFICHVCSF